MKSAAVWFLFALTVPLVAKDPEPAAPETGVVTLDAFKVRGSAVNNFSISVRVMWSKTPKRTKIFITKVLANSDAERLGLQVGDEIVKIGDVVVENVDPRVTKDSTLGKLLLNRTPGDRLKLEVITHRAKEVTLRATAASPVQ